MFREVTGEYRVQETPRVLSEPIPKLPSVNGMELALQASEVNYRTIFDAGFDAIIVRDMKTEAILDVNKGMYEMFGYIYDEALNLTIEEISIGIKYRL